MFAVPLHGTRQHLAFGVSPDGGQILDGFAVVHPGHVLLDDGAFVEGGRHVMGGGADQLHAALMGLVIRFGPFEAGQKAVVDVDGTALEFSAQVVRENLHVARQHHEFGLFCLDDFQLARFGLRFGGSGHGHVMERNVVAGGQLVEVPVVADDGAHVQRQQSAFAAKEQIVEAMALAADHDDAAHRRGGVMQRPAHVKALGQLRNLLLQRQDVDVAGKSNPHEEQPGVTVVVLRRLFDVAPALEQEAGNGMHDTRAVRAGEVQNVRGHAVIVIFDAQLAFHLPMGHGDDMAFHDFHLDNHWLPFTPNRHFRQQPRVFVGAQGMHFTTHDGRQVIDGISSLWCVGAGHNRRELNEAIKQQLDTLDYATAFQMGNDKAFQAAEAIAALAPGDLNKVLFCNSGSEAADTSLKVALAYHRARGEGHRTVFIGRERGYHGVGFGGMSVGGIPANRKAFGTALLPRVDHMPFFHNPERNAYYNWVEPSADESYLNELEQRILPLHDPSNVAAIIVEPVAGSAGWFMPPQGYLKRLRDICNRHGILLIFDEVITGFGRLGVPFGADFYGVVPDMLNFAKCVTNGIIPLGGVVCRDMIYDAMMGVDAPEHGIEFFHGYTYSGHPVACAAALATLKLLKEEDLFARAGAMGRVLGDAMHAAFKGLPNVISIRSHGLAGAVEMSPRAGAAGRRTYDIFLDCFQRGVLVRPSGESLVLAPPFIVEPSHIDQMVSTVADSIRRHA